MRKSILCLGLAATLAAAPSVALAGLNASGNSVYVLANTYASGSVSGARYSSDATQYIGCSVSASAGSSPWLWCFANSPAGTYLGCTTQDASLIAIAHRINETSEITFDASGGTCTYLNVENASYFLH